MNKIEIRLLSNRKFLILSGAKSSVITAEHNATEITVQFPDDYENYSKRIDFVTSKGNIWTEKLYVPEYDEYTPEFDKSVFSFTLPNEVTVQGELKMQFVAYMPDESLTSVPFEVIPIYVDYGITAFKKGGRQNPDLLILSYNQSTEALFNSQQAKSIAVGAETKAEEALSAANSAVTTSESVSAVAIEARENALDAKGASAAAAHISDMAYTAAGNAIIKADEAIAKSQEAKSVSETSEAKADLALSTKVDKEEGKGLSANDYTDAEKQKLEGIEAGAEVNVQADWNESDSASDAYIKNKPISMPADGGNADTMDGKHASDFATAAQGLKADTALQSFTETDPTVPVWAKQPQKPTYIPSEIGAEPENEDIVKDANYVHTDNNYTLEEKNKLSGIEIGAKVNVQSDWNENTENSDSFIINKPQSLPAAGGNADTVDGKHSNEFATAEQGAKADTALQSFTESDPTVSAWAKAAAKPTYTPNEVGAEPTFSKNTAFNKNFGNSAGTVCEGNDSRLSDSRPANGGNADTVDGKHASEFATAAQGGKADSALQSFTETDPTVPVWAKSALKPEYSFSEIIGIASKLQIPADFLKAGNNAAVTRDIQTGDWTITADIPVIYNCNGINDNVVITQRIKDFYNSTTLSDTANLKIIVCGNIGINSFEQYGSGGYSDHYRAFDFGISGYTGKRKVFIDFSATVFPAIDQVNATSGKNHSLMYNYGNDLYITGMNMYFRYSGAYGAVTGLYGNNYYLNSCFITITSATGNTATGIYGSNINMADSTITIYGPSGTQNYGISGENAYMNNCRIIPGGGALSPLNSNNAFVIGCKLKNTGVSTAQTEVNYGTNSYFLNSRLEIDGKGTLRANAGNNCYFLNCDLIATSTESNSSIQCNSGSNCFFSNCRLTATGNTYNSVIANVASNCFFTGCVLTATNSYSSGQSYGVSAWKIIMVACDIYAYRPTGGTGKAIGVFLNSTASNKCILTGCRLREVAVTGYEQSQSIVIDGTTSGGQYMITDNFIQGAFVTHSATGDNGDGTGNNYYVKQPNIIGGLWT